eukprot:TRINITY_DN49228_c0_g1_i1.p1 TRINITY_DN49228_c0_g1~~TRINITY_DN49228_c0_g1_i1.p1  ORF type:complete len:166 (+),score=23.76 TRINITY_DN49228_c0_g1_i1:66-500(+)
MTPSAFAFVFVSFVAEMASPALACVTTTSGKCNLMACFKNGETVCEGGRCICREGYCAMNDVCVASPHSVAGLSRDRFALDAGEVPTLLGSWRSTGFENMQASSMILLLALLVGITLAVTWISCVVRRRNTRSEKGTPLLDSEK